jgi:hypothetical protein
MKGGERRGDDPPSVNNFSSDSYLGIPGETGNFERERRRDEPSIARLDRARANEIMLTRRRVPIAIGSVPLAKLHGALHRRRPPRGRRRASFQPRGRTGLFKPPLHGTVHRANVSRARIMKYERTLRPRKQTSSSENNGCPSRSFSEEKFLIDGSRLIALRKMDALDADNRWLRQLT